MLTARRTETTQRPRPLALHGAVLIPVTDVREQRDSAVRRGWAEIGRRAARVCVLLAADVASVLAAFVVLEWWLVSWQPGLVAETRAFRAVAVVVLPLALKALGAYDTGHRRPRLRTALGAGIVASGVTWAVRQPVMPVHLHLVVHAAYALAAAASFWLTRLLLNAAVDRAYAGGVGQRRVIVVGSDAEMRRVEQIAGVGARSHVRVVGRLSLDRPGTAGEAAWKELELLLRSRRATGVLLAAELPFEMLETVVHRCFELGASVALVPQLLHKLNTRVELRDSGGGALLQLHSRGLGVPQLAVKRILDLVFCSVGLVLLSPLLLLIAAAIKLDSRGAVLFRQVRAGVGGRPFAMFKFRTMVENADRMKGDLQHLNQSGDPRLFKIKGDPRVTRVGRLLRRTSLDELPQLLNVIRGDMSLVGPRPFFPGDLDGYEEHHFERLLVLPGITGLWQVSGRSDVVDFEEVVRLDAEYIRGWSVKLDLQILARTIPAAFGRDGAY
ncbi:MAG TPA: exopolysaccharide biosynthesis polyprenyl glycosylphosphotransferase [Longimicrobium sp.]|jgi:exopolysaccharide biosynthesis polyprenyl glycosylphosphotransferase